MQLAMVLLTDSHLLNLLGIVTASVVIIYSYFKWAYKYWERRGVSYLEPTIPFGNLQNPFKRTLSIGEDVARVYRLLKEKGWKHAGVYSLNSPIWMVPDPKLLKHVMTKDFNTFVNRGMYTNERDDPLSGHLFSIGGAKWRNLRTKLSPTFTSGKMKSMFQTVIDCGAVLERYLMEHMGSKEAVDIKDVLGCFSTDVIGSCAFGLDCNSFTEPDAQFRKYGKKIFETTYLRRLKSAFCMSFPNAGRALRLRSTKKDVSDFFMKAVEDTVNYREKNNYVRNDFLQLLINIKSKDEAKDNTHKGDGTSLTLDEIAAQCFVFFLAGFETSSTTMTFALYELATHQHLQDKVRTEINTVLAKHDNKITYDSLNELKYMTQVIDETLRKYPPAPLLTRVCGEDYKVPGEEIIIEKDTKVFISVLGLHHDAEYFKDPEVFDPERFNEENKDLIPQYTYLPFGEGPRVCIGERFGIMQTKVGLTSILRNFRVTVNKKTQVPLKMDIKSVLSSVEGGVWLNLEKL